MLFKDKPRTLEEGIPYGMGPFDYLDQSARPEAAKVRALLEEMLANYPEAHAPGMANRLRTNDETTHNAAFLELCLHEVLVRRGYVVEDVEEPAPGSAKRPDYLLRDPDGPTFYLEATVASGLSDKGLAAERRLSTVLDALRLLQHPRFMVAVQGPKRPTDAVSISKLRKQVFAWLDSLDPEALAPPVEDESEDDEEGDREADRARDQSSWARTFVIGDYRLALKAVPRRPGADLRVGIASIAYPLRALSPVDAIRKKLFDKAGRYGNELGRPFFIAVSSTQLLQRDEDFEQAAFGRVAYSWVGDSPDAVATRQRDGLWLQGSGPRYSRVTGVLCFSKLTPWSLASAKARVLLNPFAERPMSLDALGLPMARVVDDELQTTDGLTIASIMGLTPGWPG